ncbi:phosphatidate cytidylyltransferase [Orrella sp. JC864]|uniref:phosphatidate cytidylyltransferase n=1 Tax=Orrella sp. JC864 TaxID=3120298 RepID=UPI0012BC34E6
MLGTRIVTAIVLLLLVGVCLWVENPWPFLVLLSVATGCALWEWLRLTAAGGRAAAGAGIALGLLTLASAALWLGGDGQVYAKLLSYGIAVRGIVPLAVLGWAVAAVCVIQGRAGAPARSVGWSLFALPALYAAWVSLAVLYLSYGAGYVLTLMALVWVADIGAYFTGRSLGRHKLAPRVSPGKTWEGAAGGVLLAVVFIGLSAQWTGTFGHGLAQRWGLGGALAWALLLAAVSIVGDLFESLLKRRAGYKDSSQLLPGHGGVYDRIDALVPVAPIALLLSGSVF